LVITREIKENIMVALNEKQYELLKEMDELWSTDSEKLGNAFVIYHNMRELWPSKSRTHSEPKVSRVLAKKAKK